MTYAQLYKIVHEFCLFGMANLLKTDRPNQRVNADPALTINAIWSSK